MPTKQKRKPLTPGQRQRVARKTGRKCHVCGGRLDANWQADHVRPFYRGGECIEDNFLPSCTHCNRARWGYDPRTIRRILTVGIYMLHEIEKRTSLGKTVEKKYKSRQKITHGRRV